jgi:demethylmenaquinone methyltransferase / 2-methoxy-6-polyprenyl-1,4-benzoquinol methylase
METAAPGRRPLQKMFNDVPPAYDLLNRTLTFRFDQVWRRQAASECLENNPSMVLDLCCGTGDLAIQLARAASPAVSIKALDYSEPMLWLARDKAERRKLPVEFIHGDAAAMPFGDATLDSVGIAFAFRNLTFHNPDRDKFLSEILRIIKPGGRFVIVETSQPKNQLLRKLFHFYLDYITAPVGGILSGHYGAYHYLAHSARNYYNREELTDLLITAGFSRVVSKPLMGGIAGIFTAVK